MRRTTIGIIAHVDSGKTTLSEGMLYTSGSIRKLGRVDQGDSFLDTDAMERARGITIFSKQAIFKLGGADGPGQEGGAGSPEQEGGAGGQEREGGPGDLEVTLLDTPGHVDLSAEMERTLQVLDNAILVISGADGVQGHTLTLWRLLKRYQVPVFLFINKMDQPGTERTKLMAELKEKLDGQCVDLSADPFLEDLADGDRQAFFEELAMCDEALLERYLERGYVEEEEFKGLIRERKVFPCYFGSALKLEGVEAFLKGLSRYAVCPERKGETFGAKVFKISRDAKGNRLTHMKITGGSLKIKDSPAGTDKVEQIRLYSGTRFKAIGEAEEGMVCAVTGLTKTYAGQGLGAEEASGLPVLEPVLSYQILLPDGQDTHTMLMKLKQLEEEEPLLHILWDEQLGEIHAQLMGEVQIDVLKNSIKERSGVEVEFSAGSIVYKETILGPVEGVGHFEPLRHYAEVHLLLEPGERGSGLQFATDCSEDVLARNWQRLILTHLEEKAHKGVLTGSPITDMKITLTAGRAHQKHTEGGDFRQATYRALRQGLMKAESILLEPYYRFRLELPAELVGRAMSDLQQMSGTFEIAETTGETAVLTGNVPVVEMRGYQLKVAAYSKGMGRLTCTMEGYGPCHDEEAVLVAADYDPELDMADTPDSVFCSHGAGFIVPWYQVEGYMHVESGAKPALGEEAAGKAGEEAAGRAGAEAAGKAGTAAAGKAGTDAEGNVPSRYRRSVSAAGEIDGKALKNASAIGQSGGSAKPAAGSVYSGSLESDKELEEIFRRTYGDSKRRRLLDQQQAPGGSLSGGRTIREQVWRPPEPVEEYLLVDGYNIIFAWEDLKDLAKTSLDGARQRLMDILCNYQGFKKCHVILVFDAYRVAGHSCEVQEYLNIHVVYTKEAETADQYIEKTVHELAKKHQVTVATSDGLEQIIILGQGALRMSAAELLEEVERTNETIRTGYLDKPRRKQNLLFEGADEETAAYVEDVRGR